MRSVPANPEAATSRLLRISQAALELSLSSRSIWRLAAKGDLSVVRCGRAARITRESIDRFIARGGTAR